MDARDAGVDPLGREAMERLLRWQEAGGVWRVLLTAGPGVTVTMHSCDGGAEMDRISSSDPAFLVFVDDHGGLVDG